MVWDPLDSIEHNPKVRLKKFADERKFFLWKGFKSLKKKVEHIIHYLVYKAEITDRLQFKIDEHITWEAALWEHILKELNFIDSKLSKTEKEEDSWPLIRLDWRFKDKNVLRIKNYLFYIRQQIKEQMKLEEEVEELKKKEEKAKKKYEVFIIPQKAKTKFRNRNSIQKAYRKASNLMRKNMEETESLH